MDYPCLWFVLYNFVLEKLLKRKFSVCFFEKITCLFTSKIISNSFELQRHLTSWCFFPHTMHCLAFQKAFFCDKIFCYWCNSDKTEAPGSSFSLAFSLSFLFCGLKKHQRHKSVRGAFGIGAKTKCFYSGTDMLCAPQNNDSSSTCMFKSSISQCLNN